MFRIPFLTRLVVLGGEEGTEIGVFGFAATWERCRASLSGLIVDLVGLAADFLLVNTALRTRLIGVGDPSREARDGGAAIESWSEGVFCGLGEKSRETSVESLSVADATRLRSPGISLRRLVGNELTSRLLEAAFGFEHPVPESTLIWHGWSLDNYARSFCRFHLFGQRSQRCAIEGRWWSS